MNKSALPLLDVQNIHVYYDAIHAVRGVSLHVMPGELVCLIGANGAGKSTLLKSIARLLPHKTGEIFLNGDNISHAPAHTLITRGLTLVPEGRGIFADMDVLENLRMGVYCRHNQAAIKQDIEQVFSLFPRLAERQQQTAGTLSGGEQQMLAIARALLAKPKLLLLDEPSMGLAPILVQTIFDVIKDINQQGVSVLLVEQNANAALALASRAYVMEHGAVILSGAAQAVLHDTKVKIAYLGG